MEYRELIAVTQKLDVRESNLGDSVFRNCCLDRSRFDDVSILGVKITDANLSDLEIGNAQLGGAYIHDVGMPPPGHPAYDAAAKQRPLRFDNCNLSGSTITDCNLTGVALRDCDLSGVSIEGSRIEGMRINGVLVEDLLTLLKI